MELAQYFHLKVVDIYHDLIDYNELAYDLKLASSIIDGVSCYKQHTISLYHAEAIIKNYRGEREAEALLDKLYFLREERRFLSC